MAEHRRLPGRPGLPQRHRRDSGRSRWSGSSATHPSGPGSAGTGCSWRGHTLYAVTNKTVGEQLVSWTRKVRLSDDWRRAYVVDDSPFSDSQFDAWPGTAPYTVDVVRGVR